MPIASSLWADEAGLLSNALQANPAFPWKTARAAALVRCPRRTRLFASVSSSVEDVGEPQLKRQS